MRQLVPIVVLVVVPVVVPLSPASPTARAQVPHVEEEETTPSVQQPRRRAAEDPYDTVFDDDREEEEGEDDEAEGDPHAPTDAAGPEEVVATPTAPVLPPPPAMTQAYDEERAVPPATESDRSVGEGLRLLLSLQLNAAVGDLTSEPGGLGGAFPFERATLAGVPDVWIGLRYDRFTAGLGATWSMVGQPTEQVNFCTGMSEDFDDDRAFFGILPTVRGDFLVADEGRARFEGGITVPLLLSTRSTEINSGDCTMGGRTTNETTDGVYGIDAHLGGRYHIWPALSVGVEVGLSFLAFDQDENPDTPTSEPTVTTLTIYSGLSLSLEVPL